MLDKFEPWTTQAEALRTRHVIPVSPKTYDFLDQLTDTYQARPLNPASRVALRDLLTVVFLAGEISGKRKDRARRKGGEPR